MLESSLPRRVDAMVTPDSKLPFAPHFTAKALIWKMAELSRGALGNFEMEKLAPVILLESRAAIETSAGLLRNVTDFSWKEEVVAKRDKAVPFSLEDELQKRGAKYSKALLPFSTPVVEDGRLITGQNPGSAEAVGKAVVKALQVAQAA